MYIWVIESDIEEISRQGWVSSGYSYRKREEAVIKKQSLEREHMLMKFRVRKYIRVTTDYD